MNENDPMKYDGFYGHGTEDSEWRKRAREDEAFDAQARKDKTIAEVIARTGSYTQTYGENPVDRMDSMINSYKRQKSLESHPVADAMKVLNTDPLELRRRRSEATDRFIGSFIGRETRMILGVIIFIIMGLAFAGDTLVQNVAQVTRANEMERLMSVYTPIEGEADLPLSRSFSSKNRYHYLRYEYEYGGREYSGICRTNDEQLEEFGLFNRGNDSIITVYVDPEKPERSIFLPEPYPPPLSWTIIPGGVAMVIGAVLYYYRRREQIGGQAAAKGETKCL